MNVARAFVIRDFRAAWSYRFSFLVQIGSMLASLLSLKFTASLFSDGQIGALQEYGGDYFSFALLGVSLTLLSYPAVKSYATSIRGAQMTGTFEAMLATRARPASIVLGAGAYPIVAACLEFMITVAAGAALFGAQLRFGGIGATLLVICLLVISLTGIGLMAAAFGIAFKQNEPFTGALLTASVLLSGILYPTSVLPGWLEWMAPLIPVTHAIEIVRRLMLGGSSGSIVAHTAALVAFCLTLPIGLVCLSAALKWSKQTGSLGAY